MAITLTGSNGLFTRLGRLMDLAKKVRTHQALLVTELNDIIGQYSAADMHMLGNLPSSRQDYIEQAGGIVADISIAMEKTLVEMAYADAVTGTTDTMVDKTTLEALKFLVRQMTTAGSTLEATTITNSTSASGSNTGTGAIAISLQPSRFLSSTLTQWPNVRTETLVLTCTQDAQNGAIPKYTEEFTVRGQPTFDNLDYRFPAGSGTYGTLRSVTSAISSGSRYENVLTNSGFETYNTSVPDYWAITSGVAGVTVDVISAAAYTGSYGLAFVGDGLTLHKVTQVLKTSTDTQGALTPDRPYVLSMWCKQNGTVIAGSANIRVSLQDGSGNILNSGAFYASTDAGLLSASTWTNVKVALQLTTKHSWTSEAKVVIDLTGAINAKSRVYIDEVVLAEMKQFQAGGPALAMISGSTPWIMNDQWYATLTNNGEGEVHKEMDRFFKLYDYGLAFPVTTAAATVADTVIT